MCIFEYMLILFFQLYSVDMAFPYSPSFSMINCLFLSKCLLNILYVEVTEVSHNFLKNSHIKPYTSLCRFLLRMVYSEKDLPA